MTKHLDLEAAYADFVARVEANKTRPRIDNSKQPAGSPMHYDCESCCADMERDEDDFTPRKKHCTPCATLKAAGVLDEFIARAQQQAA